MQLQRKNKRQWWWLAAMAAGVWVAGCSQQSSTSEGASAGAAVQGGELVYLEQQAHTNLYPPAGGFYPNGGVLNQITDKLTYQDPKTLEIQPWIAESWAINDQATEFTFKLRSGVTFSDGTPLDAAAVAKNFDTYGLGNKALKLPVVTPHFKEKKDGEARIISFYAKKARGGMARFAIENRLEKVEDLKAYDRDGYRFDKNLSTDTDWIFIREGNS